MTVTVKPFDGECWHALEPAGPVARHIKSCGAAHIQRHGVEFNNAGVAGRLLKFERSFLLIWRKGYAMRIAPLDDEQLSLLQEIEAGHQLEDLVLMQVTAPSDSSTPWFGAG